LTKRGPRQNRHAILIQANDETERSRRREAEGTVNRSRLSRHPLGKPPQQDSRALRAPLRDELLCALLRHFHCAGVAFDCFAEGFRGGLIVTQFETPKRQPNITAIPTGHAGTCNESGVTCSGMTPFDLPAGAV
jgi:hypothetical protein